MTNALIFSQTHQDDLCTFYMRKRHYCTKGEIKTKMRLFHGLLFLGSGDFSKKECEALHNRLDNGLELSSYGQQGPMPGELLLDLEEVVKDIAAALLGRNIEFTDALPYPSEPRNLTPILRE